jgi:hypothetical protein
LVSNVRQRCDNHILSDSRQSTNTDRQRRAYTISNRGIVQRKVESIVDHALNVETKAAKLSGVEATDEDVVISVIDSRKGNASTVVITRCTEEILVRSCARVALNATENTRSVVITKDS